ncbi:MAG: hypothetical protein AB7U73_15935 [Pirellulales bacterium]
MGRTLPRWFVGLIAAPLAIAVAYHEFLAQRSDYLGHYLAGCGGTLLLLVAAVATFTTDRFARWAPLTIVGLASIAIAIGGVFEATIYRIAKFDEVDFCNQSLGAVIAALGVLFVTVGPKPPLVAWLLAGLLAVAYLAAGYHYAFL